MTGDVKGPQKPQAAAQAPRAAEPSYWDAVAAWYLTTLPNDAARAEARDAPLLWTRDAEQTA
jgi:hypothetical protein